MLMRNLHLQAIARRILNTSSKEASSRMGRMMKKGLKMMGTGMARKMTRKRRCLVRQRRCRRCSKTTEIRQLMMRRRSLNSTLP
jgi:hypothetical protein